MTPRQQVVGTSGLFSRKLASGSSNDVARPSPQQRGNMEPLTGRPERASKNAKPKAQVQGKWGIDKRGRMRDFAAIAESAGYNHEPFAE